MQLLAARLGQVWLTSHFWRVGNLMMPHNYNVETSHAEGQVFDFRSGMT